MQSSGQYKKKELTFRFFYINKVQIYDKRTKNRLEFFDRIFFRQINRIRIDGEDKGSLWNQGSTAERCFFQASHVLVRFWDVRDFNEGLGSIMYRKADVLSMG